MSNSGLAELAYAPPRFLALSEWPTLRQMIDSNKRLVVFLGEFREGGGVWMGGWRLIGARL